MKRILFVLVVWFVVLAGIGIGMSGGGLDYDEVRVVEINHGDNLWDIASNVNDGSYNVNAVVYEIRQLNGMEDEVLVRPGDELKVPVLKGGE